MSQELNQLIEQIKRYEQAPPSVVWSRIEAHLRPKKDKPFLFWFNKSQAAVLTLGLIGSTILSTWLTQYIAAQPTNHTLQSEFPVVLTPTKSSSSIAIKEEENNSKNTEQTPLVQPKLIIKSERMIASNQTKSHTYIEKVKKGVEQTNKSSIHTTSSNYTEKSNKGGKLMASLPIVESSDGELKVYQNEEWVSLKPIENNPITSLQVNEIAQTSIIPLSDMPNIVPAISEPTQEDVRFKKGFYFAPTLGANITQVYFNDPATNPFFSHNTTFSGKFGYNAGFQLGYKFGSHWSVESGMFFSQNIQSFKEKNSQYQKSGLMYIDQLDFPLMARYSLHLGDQKYPKSISFKGGLIYNSVLQYQVNYISKDLITNQEKSVHIDADKRLYNSLQLGYIGGIDFDAFLSKRLSLNTSMITTFVSQLENFPFFKGDNKRPLQLTTTISMGIKIHF